MIAQHQENSKTKVRGVAIFLLVVEVALMFVYGFGSEFDLTTANFPTTSDNSSSLIMYILAAILPILGWGLIIAYSENSAIAGLTTTLITVGIFVQLAPPVFYFWDYLFNSVWMGRIAMSLTVEVLVMYACTSMMVAFCFVSGRLGLA